MSWKEDIENKVLSIKTGDGTIYTPLWKLAKKATEFNVSSFEFINIEGSLVRRGKTKGRKFDFELFFVGDSCIDLSNNFEISARNANNWTIEHPYYGKIICQPIGTLDIDNTDLNVSKINVSVIETLLEKAPQNSTYAADDILLKKIDIDNANSTAFVNHWNASSKTDIKAQVTKYDLIMSKAIKLTSDLNKFKEYGRIALNTIDKITATPLEIIRSINTMINYPFQLNQTIESRFEIFKEALTSTKNSIIGINTNARTLAEKRQFELFSVALLSATIASGGIVAPYGYKTSAKVLEMQENIITEYNAVMVILDENLSARADLLTAYMPDFTCLQLLEIQFNLLLANIFLIASDVKNERSIILTEDSNAILLTHKYYGLDKNDVNLNLFLEQNEIGLNEIINIKKGRKVKYYV
jgi:hypothetical protein